MYYFYYLKDGGDSYHHSIYLTTTKDFVTYTEQDDTLSFDAVIVRDIVSVSGS